MPATRRKSPRERTLIQEHSLEVNLYRKNKSFLGGMKRLTLQGEWRGRAWPYQPFRPLAMEPRLAPCRAQGAEGAAPGGSSSAGEPCHGAARPGQTDEPVGDAAAGLRQVLRCGPGPQGAAHIPGPVAAAGGCPHPAPVAAGGCPRPAPATAAGRCCPVEQATLGAAAFWSWEEGVSW